MNRRELLTRAVIFPVVTSWLRLDCEGKEIGRFLAVNYYTEHRSHGPCAWARWNREHMEKGGHTLTEVCEALAGVMTSSEVKNRLNLTLLPLDLQDDVDAGNMPLEKAMIISNSKWAAANWETAKILTVDQIRECVYHEGKIGVFVHLYGGGGPLLWNPRRLG